MADLPAPTALTPAIVLVGREREQALLRERLDATLAGRGGLVLIGGEAGIGKSTLAEWLLACAAARGARALVGRAYDLAETPPYGPWEEALAAAPCDGDTLARPNLAGGDRASSQAALFAQVDTYLATLAALRPLAILLDDLHWADPASLHLLRMVARRLSALPILLLATLRPEDVARDHPLYALLPLLVREGQPLRLDLQPLDTPATRSLVAARYPLDERDLARLARWLRERSEGNPFYTGELLRGLEDEGLLRPPHGSRTVGGQPEGGEEWSVGDLARPALPPLLRQVIDGRVARLGVATRRALEVAAIVGQEVPLALWATVGQLEDNALLRALAAAEEARLLAATADGAVVRFAHALVREALYAGVPGRAARPRPGRGGLSPPAGG